eukprot:8736129-Pyramimonas_sp.AAC.1
MVGPELVADAVPHHRFESRGLVAQDLHGHLDSIEALLTKLLQSVAGPVGRRLQAPERPFH